MKDAFAKALLDLLEEIRFTGAANRDGAAGRLAALLQMNNEAAWIEDIGGMNYEQTLSDVLRSRPLQKTKKQQLSRH